MKSLGLDYACSGDWIGNRGRDGYYLRTNALDLVQSLPPYLDSITMGGDGSINDYYYENPAVDPRYPQLPGGGRTATIWYGTSSWWMNFEFNDSNPHLLSFYVCVPDGGWRRQIIQLQPIGGGTIYASLTAPSDYIYGVWYRFVVDGPCRAYITNATNACVNAVCFDPYVSSNAGYSDLVVGSYLL